MTAAIVTMNTNAAQLTFLIAAILAAIMTVAITIPKQTGALVPTLIPATLLFVALGLLFSI
jgi:hypothetical protein